MEQHSTFDLCLVTIKKDQRKVLIAFELGSITIRYTEYFVCCKAYSTNLYEMSVKTFWISDAWVLIGRMLYLCASKPQIYQGAIRSAPYAFLLASHFSGFLGWFSGFPGFWISNKILLDLLTVCQILSDFVEYSAGSTFDISQRINVSKNIDFLHIF